MYLDHFGLAVNPFGLSPKLEFLYKSGAYEESIAHLIFGVENSEAIVMITGGIGTGKTMALQAFMDNLNEGVKWALVTNTQVSPKELLKLILEDLGVEFPSTCDKADLLILFKDFLVRTSRYGQRVIIIIDEAQDMERDVLEEIRLLTNLGQGDRQPVQIILVGQPELEAMVNNPDLAQLQQRIRVHYRLAPLSRREVEEYLDHRMAVAGCKDRVFKPAAIDRIARFSGGVPRLVNSLAGQGLLGAFVAGRKVVRAEDIEQPSGPAEAPAPPRAEPSQAVAASPVAIKKRPPDRSGVSAPIHDENPRGRRRGVLTTTLVLVLVVTGIWLLATRGQLNRFMEQYFPTDPQPTALLPGAVPADSMGITVPVDSISGPGPGEGTEDGAELADAVVAQDSTMVSGAGGQYFVQVASFKTMRRAKQFCRELEDRGFSTLIQAKFVNDLLWQRVLIGPYSDRPSAEEGLSEFPHPKDENYFPITLIETDREPEGAEGRIAHRPTD